MRFLNLTLADFNHEKIKIGSLLISILAVILSQLPPVYKWFTKPEIDIQVDLDRMRISHDFGHIIIDHNIMVKNVGQAPGTISSIYYYLEKKNDQNFQKILKLKSYQDYYDQVNQRNVYFPFYDLLFAQGSTLSTYVHFSEIIKYSDEKHYEKLKSLISDGIPEKQLFNPDPLYSVNDSLKIAIDTIINQNLEGFDKGEYRMLILYKDNKDKIIPIENSLIAFTIFDGDMEIIQKISGDYKFGGNGIKYYRNDMNGFFVKLFKVKDHNMKLKMMTKAKEYLRGVEKENAKFEALN